MKLFQIRNLFLHSLALLVAATCAVSGQVARQAVSVNAEIGPGMYFGEFNSLDYQNTFSPSTGYDEGLNVTYNPSRNFTIGLGVGRMRLVYDVYDVIRARYQASFFGPIGTPTYPGSPVSITPQNNIDVTKYLLFARTNFQPMNTLVPYFTIGLGLMSFNATNGLGEDLPTNITGTYSHKALIVPLGGGLEYYINEDFSLHVQGLIYLTSSDYLDGYAHYLDYESSNPPLPGPGQQETPSDYMGSIMLGASYVVYRPEEEEPPPPPPIAKKQPEPTPPQPEQPRDTTPQIASRLDDPEIDSDGDGLSDSSEVNRYLTDPHNPDTDGDGLTDGEEVRKYQTSPNNPDTDSDGLTDGSEVMVYNSNPLKADTDNDGLADGDEIRKYSTNPIKPDTDDDLLADGVEVTRTLTDPNNPDTDGDGVIDGLDECPTVPGDPANHGCPEGAIPASYPEKVHESGPLAGLPEVPYSNDRADFQGILFKVNSDDFDLSQPETARNLGKMLDYVKQCDDMGVVIEGHSSSEGSPTWNKALSEMRARRVRDWLIANGIDSHKILGTVGYGAALPKVAEPRDGAATPQELEQARKKNRRITMLVRKRCP